MVARGNIFQDHRETMAGCFALYIGDWFAFPVELIGAMQAIEIAFEKYCSLAFEKYMEKLFATYSKNEISFHWYLSRRYQAHISLFQMRSLLKILLGGILFLHSLEKNSSAIGGTFPALYSTNDLIQLVSCFLQGFWPNHP